MAERWVHRAGRGTPLRTEANLPVTNCSMPMPSRFDAIISVEKTRYLCPWTFEATAAAESSSLHSRAYEERARRAAGWGRVDAMSERMARFGLLEGQTAPE